MVRSREPLGGGKPSHTCVLEIFFLTIRAELNNEIATADEKSASQRRVRRWASPTIHQSSIQPLPKERGTDRNGGPRVSLERGSFVPDLIFVKLFIKKKFRATRRRWAEACLCAGNFFLTIRAEPKQWDCHSWWKISFAKTIKRWALLV